MKCNIIFVILQTAMKDITLLDRLTDSSSRIIIVVHTHPDGDAVGSGVALLEYLKKIKGKDATLIVPDSIPESISFIFSESESTDILVFDKDTKMAQERIKACDLVICLDCNSFSRTAGMENFLRQANAAKVLIDHHLNPEAGSFDLVFSKTEISSASELLFWILMQMPQIRDDASALPPACSKALLTGMTTDTNNFANSVYPSTFEMASRLIEAGVDRDTVLAQLYNNFRENRLRLMGYLMWEKLRITSFGVAYIIMDRQTQKRFDFRQGESEGFVNMPLSIADVRMSIFLTQEDDILKVSIRSKKGTSANACASRYFNGGGHEQAAGGKLTIGKDLVTVEDAEAYILKAMREFFGL